MRARTGYILLVGIALPMSVGAQDVPLTPAQLRQRLVDVFTSFAHRPLPQGDTLVTWSPNPTLLTTVGRSPDGVFSSLVRADSLNGTAELRWSGGFPATVHVLWTRPDSVLVDLRFVTRDGFIEVEGTTDSVLAVPEEPWAIADYGMEDQLLPLLAALPDGETTVSVFRPYGFQWDRMSLTVQPQGSAKLVSRRDAGTSSPTFFWLIGPSGALVRITRTDYPDNERRPLEGSRLYTEYARLMTGSDVR